MLGREATAKKEKNNGKGKSLFRGFCQGKKNNQRKVKLEEVLRVT